MWKKISFLMFVGVILFGGCQNMNNPADADAALKPTPQNTQTDSTSFNQTEGPVGWVSPAPVQSLKLFRDASKPEEMTFFVDGQTKYYKSGVIRTGKYSGDDILMAITEPDAPYYFPPIYRFVHDENKLVFLKKYSDEIDPKEFINKNILSENSDELTNLFESTLGAPEKIAIPSDILKNTSGQYHLKLTQKTSVFFSPKNLQPVFALEDGRKIFMEKNGKNSWNEKDNRLFQLHGFYLPLADNTVALYELEIPFITDFTPQITWNNGEKNSDRGGLWEGEGCRPTSGLFPKVVDGQIEFSSLISGDKSSVRLVFSNDDLSVVGKTNMQEPLYALKNEKNPFYKEYYEKVYIPTFKHMNGGALASYEKFIDSKPFLFWNDPFGRMNLLLNGNFYVGGECAGKPVIYLYPPTSQEIFVKVDSSRKQFISIPKGDDGWKVIADSESHIFDPASGKTFPYLFWEDAITYDRPQRGFVIRAADVDSFLDQKLATIGLNRQEITDFKAFWSPRMKKYPYSFVSFLQTDELNTIVPLKISPKPDSLIRVFMHFEGLEQPMRIEEQVLQPGKRSGFTVVEWGGKL